jgi:hypothetical protein
MAMDSNAADVPMILGRPAADYTTDDLRTRLAEEPPFGRPNVMLRIKIREELARRGVVDDLVTRIVIDETRDLADAIRNAVDENKRARGARGLRFFVDMANVAPEIRAQMHKIVDTIAD